MQHESGREVHAREQAAHNAVKHNWSTPSPPPCPLQDRPKVISHVYAAVTWQKNTAGLCGVVGYWVSMTRRGRGGGDGAAFVSSPVHLPTPTTGRVTCVYGSMCSPSLRWVVQTSKLGQSEPEGGATCYVTLVGGAMWWLSVVVGGCRWLTVVVGGGRGPGGGGG